MTQTQSLNLSVRLLVFEFFLFGSKHQLFADFGSFDFIVVGSGSGGGVVANRLTEVENFTVLLIEAGQTDPTISQIVGLATTCLNSAWNWGYNTTVQSNACLGNKSFYYI